MHKVTKINMTKKERLQTLEQRIAEERRTDEREAAIRAAFETVIYENRIDCSGE